MEYIHPRARFSKNAKSVSTPPSILEEAIRQFGRISPNRRVQKLSGGFMNSNFLVSDEDGRFVFRAYSTNTRTAEMERDLLRSLKPTPVLVPEIYNTIDVQGTPITIMEYIDGITLEDKLLSGEAIGMNLYKEIGAQLGYIHKIHFEKAGFFGPGVKPGEEYENSSVFLKAYLDTSLTGLEAREDRLSLDKNKRLRRLLDEKWATVLKTEVVRELVHCDFNPKNILVSRDGDPKVLAILDWEFSWVGNGLMDFGNFFRFAYDYPPEARDYFVQGYCAVKSDLPKNWDEISKVIDVGNMCFFLERKEDYQESFRTARAVIDSTLEYFGY